MLVSRIVDDVGDGTLHTLGELLLDLLRNNRILSVVQSMRLVGRLARLIAGWVDLFSGTRMLAACLGRADWVISHYKTNRVGKSLLESLRSLLLDLVGDSRVGLPAGGVGTIHAGSSDGGC